MKLILGVFSLAVCASYSRRTHITLPPGGGEQQIRLENAATENAFANVLLNVNPALHVTNPTVNGFSAVPPTPATWLPSGIPGTRDALGRRCPAGVKRRVNSPVSMGSDRDEIRNIAIVAHVDHGKTTLVDTLLEEELEKTIGKDDRLMDGNDQEKERGITILAKNAAINYEGIKVNIVDTPGHADFGGEVERVLGMVDGVLLLVDAQEGPKPQTRFVLKKAIAKGLKILVVINKIDKPGSRPDYVLDKTFDLFCELGASDEQCEFEVVYSSAVNRQSGPSPDALQNNMNVLKDAILKLPKPVGSVDESLQLQISNVGKDQYIGRLGVGRIKSGTLKPGVPLGLSAGPGKDVKQVKLTKLFLFDAMGKTEVEEASAGDIVVFAGIPEFDIGNTVVDLDDPRPLDPIDIEQPTMAIRVGVNKSPFSGKSSAKFLTGSVIKDRLAKEIETNVALKVTNIEGDDAMQVYGRGLLHLTVLLESMRREGFELQVGPPKVLFQEGEGGEKLEPFEEIEIEVPEDCASSVVAILNARKGIMTDMAPPTAEGMQSLAYSMPTRCMVGVKSQVLTATKGLAIMTSTFGGYKAYAGDLDGRLKGNLVSMEQGVAAGHALMKLQARGEFFVAPQEPTYAGQIVGINAKPEDMAVNICKTKQLTNMRASGSDENLKLVPPKPLSLEEAVEYIVEGEYVELTPEEIRMGVEPKEKARPR
jgi:GTP-binding protein